MSATLEQCVTSEVQAERAATFAGEMASIAGSTKMEMRIDVLERAPREMAFHMVSAPGLGVWRTAAPGVKSYRYLKEVTNLAAPAFYRAVVRYRWFNAQGPVDQDRRTAHAAMCPAAHAARRRNNDGHLKAPKGAASHPAVPIRATGLGWPARIIGR